MRLEELTDEELRRLADDFEKVRLARLPPGKGLVFTIRLRQDDAEVEPPRAKPVSPCKVL
jgi:hypothetical protein